MTAAKKGTETEEDKADLEAEKLMEQSARYRSRRPALIEDEETIEAIRLNVNLGTI